MVTFVSAKFGTLPVLVLFSSPLLSFSLPRVRLSVSCISKKDFLFPLALLLRHMNPQIPLPILAKGEKNERIRQFPTCTIFFGGPHLSWFVCPVCANLWGINVHVESRQMLTTHRDIANVCYPYVKRKKTLNRLPQNYIGGAFFAMHHLGWFPYQEVELIYT